MPRIVAWLFGAAFLAPGLVMLLYGSGYMWEGTRRLAFDESAQGVVQSVRRERATHGHRHRGRARHRLGRGRTTRIAVAVVPANGRRYLFTDRLGRWFTTLDPGDRVGVRYSSDGRSPATLASTLVIEAILGAFMAAFGSVLALLGIGLARVLGRIRPLPPDRG